MTLDDRYRIHNKLKKNKLLRLYILIILSLIFSLTMSRYTSSSDLTLGIEVAKWDISINNTEVTPQTTKLDNKIEMVVTENQDQDGYIKAGQKGYFDIKIEPKYTEVSIQYNIKINTEDLPNEIKLTKYSINNSSEKIDMTQNKTITGQILIDEKENLDEDDTKIYRVYWEWNAENSKIQINDYKLKTDVEIKQLID